MKVLIIGSGDFKLPGDARERYIIACDGGLDRCAEYNLRPERILGDFDSVSQTSLDFFADIPKTRFPVKKDMTDIELGLELAFKLGASDITVTGALSGTRLDHTLCNIQLLLKCLKRGIVARIINKTNTIMLMDGKNKLRLSNDGRYVSILPVTQRITGLTLKGFEYPLENHTLKKGSSLCVSNKIAKKSAEIEIDGGIAAIFLSADA